MLLLEGEKKRRQSVGVNRAGAGGNLKLLEVTGTRALLVILLSQTLFGPSALDSLGLPSNQKRFLYA